MKKSLVAILHHNTTHYTEALYEMLKPYERDDYDLVVIDNGSAPGKTSKYTTYRSDENTGYGGGLDMSLQLFRDSPEYDSFTLLNSDLVIHGYNFFRTLRKLLYSRDDLMIVSPCVIQPQPTQCFWKQMHCWNSTELRIVPFIDYQCAFMKREFAEHVKGFGSRYGWVQDLVTGVVCEEKGWKIAVCDWLPIVHIGNGTVKENPQLSNYNVDAQAELDAYLVSRNLVEKTNQLKMKAINYKYE
jgi:GT2 family glycosyltransferase